MWLRRARRQLRSAQSEGGCSRRGRGPAGRRLCGCQPQTGRSPVAAARHCRGVLNTMFSGGLGIRPYAVARARPTEGSSAFSRRLLGCRHGSLTPASPDQCCRRAGTAQGHAGVDMSWAAACTKARTADLMATLGVRPSVAWDPSSCLAHSGGEANEPSKYTRLCRTFRGCDCEDGSWRASGSTHFRVSEAAGVRVPATGGGCTALTLGLPKYRLGIRGYRRAPQACSGSTCVSRWAAPARAAARPGA